MLVLTRKKNQSIMIGDLIEVVVVGVSGDQIKLGINAPRNIAVHRKEIYEEIKNENIKASKMDISDLKHINRFLNDIVSKTDKDKKD